MQGQQPTSPSFEGTSRPLLAGLLAIQAFLGYEWLMSGLAKALDGNFVTGLGGALADSTQGVSGIYRSFLDGVVIPNAQAFAYLVMFGELAIGTVLIAVAAIWWFRWQKLSVPGRYILLGLIVLAGAFGIFMNINFHIASGATHPWLIAADPFDEGIDLGSVMPLIQLAISIVSASFLLQVRAANRRAAVASMARAAA